MPERCDICGIAALESEHFAEEALPFRRAKRYCPACRQRFYRRVFAVLAAIPLVSLCVGILGALHHHADLFDSMAVRWSLLMIFQWLMILPHELGHAAAGRVLGFGQIRILVGSGKPMFSFQLFSIPTIINLLPFGAVTLSKPGDKISRWRLLGFVGAGLTVNVLAAVIAQSLIAPGELFAFREGGVWMLFFWANLIVLAENLLPHRTYTPFGILCSDGLQLWNLLFRWNKRIEPEPALLPRWELGGRHLLKWTTFALMAGATLFFVCIACLPFFGPHQPGDWQIRVVLPAVMLALALVTGWAAVRIARHSVPTTTMSNLPAGLRQLLSLKPEHRLFLQKALERANQNDFSGAEALMDQVLATLPDSEMNGRWPLLQLKLEYIMSQNDAGRAEKVCLDWVSRMTTVEDKIRILDAFTSHVLYKSASSFLDAAERLARQALELAPGTLTLKGTLGGVLAEQGRLEEAQQLLRECLDRSPALHDQGISAFYLGVVKLAAGDSAEAKRLLRRGMVLHPEPWLIAKAQSKLKELGA